MSCVQRELSEWIEPRASDLASAASESLSGRELRYRLQQPGNVQLDGNDECARRREHCVEQIGECGTALRRRRHR